MSKNQRRLPAQVTQKQSRGTGQGHFSRESCQQKVAILISPLISAAASRKEKLLLVTDKNCCSSLELALKSSRFKSECLSGYFSQNALFLGYSVRSRFCVFRLQIL